MTITITGEITVSGAAHFPNYVIPREPGDTAITMGAYGWQDVIFHRIISTLGNASAFGSLSTGRREAGGASNGVDGKGMCAGGINSSTRLSSVEYRQITTGVPASGGFGNLLNARRVIVGLDNSINDRAVFTGGIGQTNEFISDAEYYTVSTGGNATPYGNLLNHTDSAGVSNGSNDRGVYTMGAASMRYITISTISTSLSFPSLVTSRPRLAAASNSINDKALFGGGSTNVSFGPFIDSTDLVNIATAATASFFGNLTVARAQFPAASNGINERAIFMCGHIFTADTTTIDYFTINSLSNALEFGDFSGNFRSMAPADNGGT